MNITQAVEWMGLRVRTAPEQRSKRQDVVRRIWQQQARGLSMKRWAEAWLPSKEFVLMNVPTARVAAPYMHLPGQRLQHLLATASSVPVVVDWNKRRIGKSPSGFCPQVILVDGVDLLAAARLQGRETIPAWVGVKALRYLNVVQAHGSLGMGSGNNPLETLPKLNSGATDVVEKTPSPGSGVGPRLKPNKGAKHSDFQKVKFVTGGVGFIPGPRSSPGTPGSGGGGTTPSAGYHQSNLAHRGPMRMAKKKKGDVDGGISTRLLPGGTYPGVGRGVREPLQAEKKAGLCADKAYVKKIVTDDDELDACNTRMKAGRSKKSRIT